MIKSEYPSRTTFPAAHNSRRDERGSSVDSFESLEVNPSIFSPGRTTGASSLTEVSQSASSDLSPSTRGQRPSQVPSNVQPVAKIESLQALKSRACRAPTELSDQRLIRQLFAIYWTWIHPDHKILSMQQFIDGYENGTDLFCSLYLVYALCIAACEYLDPLWEHVEGKYTDVAELRRNLVTEARRVEASMEIGAPTRVQASAILSRANERFRIVGIRGRAPSPARWQN